MMENNSDVHVEALHTTQAPQTPRDTVATPRPAQTPVPDIARVANRVRELIRWITPSLKAYTAMLVAVGVALPIMASAITLGFYLSQPSASALMDGALLSWVIWLVLSALLSFLATAKGANKRSYCLIAGRMQELKARLGLKEGPDGHPAPMTDEEMLKAVGLDMSCASASQLIAVREAHIAYSAAWKSLYHSCSGLAWVLGIGYVNAWSLVHRAEEALIEVVSPDLMIRGAMHDKACIQHSRIANRDDLLAKLTQAVKDLDPLAMIYFSKKQPLEGHEELLNKLMQATMGHRDALRKLGQAINQSDLSTQIEENTKLDFEDTHEEPEEQVTVAPSLEMRARARLALREVRRTLNEFRDSLWEGIVRTRNHLLVAILLMGLVTHSVLCIAILTAGSSHILAAIIYYMAGAMAGLFGRLYSELAGTTTIDDYNLSLTQWVVNLLVSGLAGVGGVLITSLVFSALLAGNSLSQEVLPPASLQSVFRLDDPYALLASAIFGLAPNVIIRSLQQKMGSFSSSLKSSKSSGQEIVKSGK
ncbi:MAG TPA: hypothetical protein VKR06_33740 [Ktedonosporobacter sp.]|nr:hypothetical protein [Ktedonosporobacter sp.]